MRPYYQDELVTLYHGDCRDVLPLLAADAVITDPPYGVGFDSWDSSIPEGWLDLAKASAPIVAFTTAPTTLWDYPRPDWVLCWYRPAAQSRTAWGGFNHWTPIPVYGRGAFSVDVINLHAMQRAQRARKVSAAHSSPKPAALIRWLLAGFGSETVIDPFAGGGSTLRAAKATGVKATGIEINEQYCEAAADSLRQGSLAEMFQA